VCSEIAGQFLHAQAGDGHGNAPLLPELLNKQGRSDEPRDRAGTAWTTTGPIASTPWDAIPQVPGSRTATLPQLRTVPTSTTTEAQVTADLDDSVALGFAACPGPELAVL
jgi:hypothetical protein